MEISHILAFCLLLAGSNAFPQLQNWNQPQENFDYRFPTPDPNSFTRGQPIRMTTARTTTPDPTTFSPEFMACVQKCPVTAEYNPICGTDNINYYNPARFNCAKICGKSVQRLHSGICDPQ